jgi:predicted acylesterase/phospholipase RssA
MDINNIIDNKINDILDKKNNKAIDTLVFSGGSIKGIAQLGALQCLLENDIIDIDKIKHIAGTSAGAMIGLLLCIGYKPEEVFRFMKLVKLENTRKIDMTNLIKNFGLDNGKRIMLVMKKTIKI